MKLIAILVLILSSIIVTTNVVSGPVPIQRDWQPVIGISPDAPFKTYYDRNSIQVNEEENGNYTSGTLLIVSKEPVIIQINNKPVPTRSLMKNYVVVCETGLSLAYSDYFFNVPMPTPMSTPVASVTRGLESAEPLSKDSIIYHTFCPVYI